MTQIPWNKGKSYSPRQRAMRKVGGNLHSFQFQPDACSYSTAHRRIRQVKGTPSRCEHCSTTKKGRYVWAYTGPGHKSGDRIFSMNIDDYIRLCDSCHKRFDK